MKTPESIGEPVLLDLDRIVPVYASADENPNKMEPERFDLLVQAVERYGFLQAVLVRKFGSAGGKPRYQLIDGHHRYWAMQKARRTQLLAQIADVDDVQARALSLAMNRLRGDLDLRMSAEAIQSIVEITGWDIETVTVSTGFTAEEIDALLQKTALNAQDILGESLGEAEDERAPAAPFVLEIPFADRESYRLAKRKLKKAAGKGGDLARGLLNLLGEV